MKRLFLLFFPISLALALAFGSCKNKKIDGADEYCDSVVRLQNEVLVQVDSFFQSTRYVKYNTADFFRKAVEITSRNLLTIKQLGAYENDPTLWVSSQQLLQTIDEMLATEGREIVRLDSVLLQNYDGSRVLELDGIENDAILKIQRAQQLFDSCQVLFLENAGFDVVFDDVEIDSLKIENEE